MNRQKVVRYFLLLLVSFFAGLAGAVGIFKTWIVPQLATVNQTTYTHAQQVRFPYPAVERNVSFVKAAELSRNSVVYIKSQSQGGGQSQFDFFDFFGNIGPVSSSGSGVIISTDGYIVTNSHVVKDADKIEVVLNNNKRNFIAKVVGVDPSSDLALLKIEAGNLTSINFANSDELPVGDWVLAVGNPFNLTSTVTAGIVSAKGRNINLVKNQFPIESFIQTDAAINPGNSGGALVNLDGNLVGINTAIFSKTGSYTGYGFAIPSNIVRKVIKDLKEFGYVQRAFIEADVSDIDDDILDKMDEENISGVYVRSVAENGNGDKAGLKKGDVILKVDGTVVDSRAVFDEQMAYHRPGDKVTLVVKRGKNVKEMQIELTNLNGTTSLEKSKSLRSTTLGAEFSPISKMEKEKYRVNGGIRVNNITNGRIRNMNLPEGFIITSFNGNTYSDPSLLIQDLEKATGNINITGITPDGVSSSYQFYMY